MMEPQPRDTDCMLTVQQDLKRRTPSNLLFNAVWTHSGRPVMAGAKLCAITESRKEIGTSLSRAGFLANEEDDRQLSTVSLSSLVICPVLSSRHLCAISEKFIGWPSQYAPVGTGSLESKDRPLQLSTAGPT
jgi:hypothetical protein